VLRARVLATNGGKLPPPRAAGGCRLLDAAGARCTVYEARPFGCRTFFCEKRMGPVHEPTAKTHALLDELAAINIALDPASAPLTIDDWFSSSARSPAAP
jgi:Fe-S-cluster containining protein